MPQAKPKKVGRPKLPKGNAKAEMLRIRATTDELRAFDKAAKASKQKRSEWVRSTLLAALEAKG
jgi:uncharacterized protein (DUF1778 family)